MMPIIQKITGWSSDNKSKIVLFVIGIISTSLVAFTVYDSRLTIGSDAMSYISIAEHYARGDIVTAVNGYWSPAISWLMAPFIAAGVDGRLAFAIANGLAALVVILGGAIVVWFMSRRSVAATALYMVSITPFALSAARDFFPDLLLAAWMVLFLAAIFYADSQFTKHRLRSDLVVAAVLGSIGAFGYMVKLYAAPFFVATVAAWGVWRLFLYFRTKPRYVRNLNRWFEGLRLAIFTASIFLLMCAPWVGALSKKYDYLTFGSSAAINAAPKFKEPKVKKPPVSNKSSDDKKSEQTTDSTEKTQQNSKKTPVASETPTSIAAPPYDTATTSTEDRTPKGKGSSLPSVGGKSGLDNFIEGRKQGVPLFLNNMQKMWSLLLAIIIGVVIWLIYTRKSYIKNSPFYILVLSFAVYFSGYAMLAGHNGGNIRYYWPMVIIGMILVALIVGRLAQSKVSTKKLPLLYWLC